MTKRLFFAAMMCCMVICSLAFVACSDDDDSGNGTESKTEQETSTRFNDCVESITRYFYTTAANGESRIVVGTVLQGSNEDELSLCVDSAAVAPYIFMGMITSVDSTMITEHIDGSITANLTDTLGNVKGTAEFTPGGTNGVVGTVIFSPQGIIKDISKVYFIEKDAWPTNDAVSTKHVTGRVVTVNAPVVKPLYNGQFTSTEAYLSPTETKSVKMVCCNTATISQPAYYVYFDDEKFTPELNEDGSAPFARVTYDWETVEKYLPTVEVAEAFRDAMGLRIYGKKFENYLQFTHNVSNLQKHINSCGGKAFNKDEVYYTSTCTGFITTYHIGLCFCGTQFSNNRTNVERVFKYNMVNDYFYWTREYDGNKNDLYPYMLIKRVKYDEEWNGTF